MWIVFALAASVLWGLTYVINEQVYKDISVTTSLGITTLLTAVVMLLFAYRGGFLRNELTLIIGSKRLLCLIVAETLTLVLAELFIGVSISSKNAALAALVEISYPIFTLVFAYLLFNEGSLNVSTVVGAVLIFLGVFVIYFVK